MIKPKQKSSGRSLFSHCRSIQTIAAMLVLGTCARIFATEPAVAVANLSNGLPWLQTFSNDFTSANAQTYLNNWTAEWGTGAAQGLTGWGNNEWEYYNDAKTGSDLSNSNLYVNANGLNITAIVPNNFSLPDYSSTHHVVNSTEITSAKINSANYFSQTYGLFQWTISTPSGSGLWPAAWMMPKNSSYGGWPTSGEIDVVESGASGQQANKAVSGTYHSGTDYQHDAYGTATYTNASYDTRNVNTYNLLWLPAGGKWNGTTYPNGLLAWYVNGNLYEARNGGWYKPPGGGAGAPFDKPFYFILNMAVGGYFTGYPTNTRPPIGAGSYTMTISDVQAFQLPIQGDVNRDGHLDAKDLAAMQSAMADPSAYAASLGLTTSQLNLVGDINGDGVLNSADVQKLINTLKTGGGSENVPEPSTFVLLALSAIAVWGRKKLNRTVS